MESAPLKRKGFELYKHLGSPKRIVAPMVDQSEYAWRILSRRHKAELCYTPMFHARLFSDDNPKYREENWVTGVNDRPLIVQFCANDAATLLKAAKMVEDDCDAVDINLGCPQHIAKRGHYGAFLMDDWDLIADMVRTLDKGLKVPVTCKIRVFPEVEKTIRYAKMLEEAGCQLLTVHGRTREMKGHKTGLADWEIIKTVKQALKIPVFANGNILYDDDVVRCLEKTGVDGVMTAEGNLYNPAIFTGIHHPVWMLAEEYLEICKSHPNSANIGAIRGHLFKIFAPCLADFPALRTKLASIRTMDGFDEFTAEMKKGLLAANGGVSELDASAVTVDEKGIKMLPNWVAQPHLRQPLVEGARKDAEANGAEKKNADLMEETMKGSAVSEATSNKRPAEGEADGAPKKTKKQRQSSKLICSSCPNVGSEKCSHRLCKPCCKKKLKEDLGMTCEAHGKVYGKKGEKTSNNTDATTVTSTE